MPSLPRPAILFALVLASFVAGCDEDDTEPVDIGVLDGSVAPGRDASPDAPEIGNLVVSACDQQTTIQGPDITSVVRFASARVGDDMGNTATLLLTVHDGIRAYGFEAGACPGLPIASFGTGGHLPIDAVAAVPFGTDVLVATPERTLVVDQAGVERASCLNGGAEVRVRWLAAGAETWGVFVRPPVLHFSQGPSDPCLVSTQEFAQPTAMILAMASVMSGKSIVVGEQPTASSPITVSRYDYDGNRTNSSPNLPGSPVLCSVTGLLDTPQGILVADGACKQLVLYDSVSLQPIKQAVLDGAPRGLAWPGGTKVLVPVARPAKDGAEVVFQVVDLAN